MAWPGNAQLSLELYADRDGGLPGDGGGGGKIRLRGQAHPAVAQSMEGQDAADVMDVHLHRGIQRELREYLPQGTGQAQIRTRKAAAPCRAAWTASPA